jgi:RNase adaptor protein for sRNA GlmZ degradation
MRQSPKKLTKKQRGDIIALVTKHKNAIAKERDALRDILHDLEGVVDSSDSALNDLDCAIDALSQYL